MNNKVHIINDVGEQVTGRAPVIISASRSTDIPAFYADWFVERWKRGYVKWLNPFSGKPVYVSFQNTRTVVFWSKNPSPILKHLSFLKENIKNFYFQFTLNDYDKEGFEANLPDVNTRIETFKELSRAIGKERVIWRFDPLLLTESVNMGKLLERISYIGDQLHNYTTKLVFSFADISIYKKVEKNLQQAGVKYKEFTETTKLQFAGGLYELNKKWNLELASCAEAIELEQYGIIHNKCIDDELMIKLFGNDRILMDFLGVPHSSPSLFLDETKPTKNKKLKDKGQRKLCQCIVSKDIGQYNTCPHGCVYCYANASKEKATQNFRLHTNHPWSDCITGI